jgi:hypothetical protein
LLRNCYRVIAVIVVDLLIKIEGLVAGAVLFFVSCAHAVCLFCFVSSGVFLMVVMVDCCCSVAFVIIIVVVLIVRIYVI